MSGLGLVFAKKMNSKTAELYEGNVHHTLGWVAMNIVIVQTMIDLLQRFTKRPKMYDSVAAGRTRPAFRPSVNTVRGSIRSCWPGSNGRVSESPSPDRGRHMSLETQPNYRDLFERSESDDDDDGEYKTLIPGRRGFLSNSRIREYFSGRISLTLSGLSRMFEILDKITDRTILVVGYVTLVTGVVTYVGIFVSGCMMTPYMLSKERLTPSSGVTTSSTVLPTSSKAEYSSGTDY